MTDHKTEIWLQEKARLISLAYRILGSWTDAEDSVQDTYVKWIRCSEEPENLQAFLTTICTRTALDSLNSAHKQRTKYIGDWLPEFIPSDELDPIDLRERWQTISTAFLLLLEALSPRERVAYVLREIFDTDYSQIAEILETNDTNIRKIVSRAKKKITPIASTIHPAIKAPDSMITTFQHAVLSGDTSELAALLSQNIRLCTDSGGQVRALRRSLTGIDETLPFIAERLKHFWSNAIWQACSLNGQASFLIIESSQIFAAVTLCCNSSGEIDQIQIIRNPDKLKKLNAIRKKPDHF